MGLLSKLFTFINGQYADANQVNADFDQIYNWVNGGVDSQNAPLLGYNITGLSTNTVLATNQSGLIECTAGAGGITVTLPPAATVGLRFILKKVDNGAGPVTINTTSSQTIDGLLLRTLFNQYAEIEVISNGANWDVIRENVQDLSTNAMSRLAIINANLDVWQSGTSFTNPATNTYLMDMFKVISGTGGGTFPNATHTRQALTPGDIPGAFYHHRIAVDGPGTGWGTNTFYSLANPIEFGTRSLCGAGKKVTVSFWARSSIAGKKLGINFIQKYGTGGSPTVGEVIPGTIITLTANWTKYTVTVPTNTLVGKTFGTNNDDSLDLNFFYAWGTASGVQYLNSNTQETFVAAGNIDIAQIPVNAGDTALPFQPRDPEEELRKCQRFYEKSYSNNVSPLTASTLLGLEEKIVPSNTIVANQNYGNTRFKVEKRTIPTVTVYPFVTPSNTNRVTDGLGTDLGANSGVPGNMGTSGFSVANSSGGTLTTTVNKVIYHWTADARF